MEGSNNTTFFPPSHYSSTLLQWLSNTKHNSTKLTSATTATNKEEGSGKTTKKQAGSTNGNKRTGSKRLNNNNSTKTIRSNSLLAKGSTTTLPTTRSGRPPPTSSEFLKILALNALAISTAPASILRHCSSSTTDKLTTHPHHTNATNQTTEETTQEHQNRRETSCLGNKEQALTTPEIHDATTTTGGNEGALLLRAEAVQVQVQDDDDVIGNAVETPRRPFLQLSGHPGCVAPAGPYTVWKIIPPKSREDDPNCYTEKVVYEKLRGGKGPEKVCQDDGQNEELVRGVGGLVPGDPMYSLVPTYYGTTSYNGQEFLELQDLTRAFNSSTSNLALMDIKLGTRTFLESEVLNTKPRKDLYQKMLALDPLATSATPSEKSISSITKLRYMTWRESRSTSSTLGFRIEASTNSSNPTTDLKLIQTPEEVKEVLGCFLQNSPTLTSKLISRLEHMQEVLNTSTFFQYHEVIGSSLLVVHDGHGEISAWLIDFAKTRPSPAPLTHTTPWTLGNHEDGLLSGLINLLHILKSISRDGSSWK